MSALLEMIRARRRELEAQAAAQQVQVRAAITHADRAQAFHGLICKIAAREQCPPGATLPTAVRADQLAAWLMKIRRPAATPIIDFLVSIAEPDDGNKVAKDEVFA